MTIGRSQALAFEELQQISAAFRKCSDVGRMEIPGIRVDGEEDDTEIMARR